MPVPVLQKQISSRHFAELLIYDQIYGIPDAMQLERIVAGAAGVKNYKKPKPEKGGKQTAAALQQLINMARKQ